MRTVIKTLLLMTLLVGIAHAAAPAEQRRIDYLIDSVAQLHDARFVRNGRDYGADKAVSHLRMKLRYAGDRVQTAEDFIRLCATGSSMSGTPYLIRFADGHSEPSAQWLHERLAAYRPSASTPAPG
ncbi:DUF5329 domain-containing protein [Dyella sp.]|jgi:hypothetical protein|uniref:DUF5329 domain-containing protein n=1 Tax=Dyella sp. TaxID=1869338 RepID=UPI002D76D624|nr:DUF5329 domain-containing protein [Dyella sp.]HET6432494.1 DUF5329 domain-containing protein [Dyella sp.]